MLSEVTASLIHNLDIKYFADFVSDFRKIVIINVVYIFDVKFKDLILKSGWHQNFIHFNF